MLETASGAFYCVVPKQQGFLASLLHSCRSEQVVHKKLDDVYQRYAEAYSKAQRDLSVDRLLSAVHASGSGSQHVQKYVLGGGGLLVQPGIQKITECLVKVTPYVHQDKDHIVVFFGTLSNLGDLLLRRHDFQSRRADRHAAASSTGAVTSELILNLYKRFDDDDEQMIMLSELQGQYAFVIYDNHKKQAFAARDPSGAEPLYYQIGSDGCVSFTNSPEQLPADNHADSGHAAGLGLQAPASQPWVELPPGHYMVGKTITQFALTPAQLETRERTESLVLGEAGHVDASEEGKDHGYQI